MKTGTMVVILLAGLPAFGITRDHILSNAHAYAEHKWQCTSANTTVPASCSTKWKSDYTPGWYTGVCYDWGGYKTIKQFDQDLANGLGAGCHSWYGILPCTTGVDCSGFVSEVWETSHHTTTSMKQVAHNISISDIRPGDAFDKFGSHIVLYAGKSANGTPVFYEAAGSASKVRRNSTGGWSYVSGYQPIRYNWVQERNPSGQGTIASPIRINSFPYDHNGDTSNARETVFDRYSCKESADESGPEVVFTFTLHNPGVLQASVSNPAGVDTDLQLLGSLDETACIVRGDKAIKADLNPGSYFLIVDTWVNKSGVAFSGAYSLHVTFTSSVQTDYPSQPDQAPSVDTGWDTGQDIGVGTDVRDASVAEDVSTADTRDAVVADEAHVIDRVDTAAPDERGDTALPPDLVTGDDGLGPGPSTGDKGSDSSSMDAAGTNTSDTNFVFETRMPDSGNAESDTCSCKCGGCTVSGHAGFPLTSILLLCLVVLLLGLEKRRKQ